VRRRAVAFAAAVGLVAALGLAGCGSKDNGGVIQGPTGTTAPGATTTAGGGNGY
jgi:hypothetical protein